MIRFHENGKQAMEQAIIGAGSGIICTPYYTERGLQLLDPFFDRAEKVEFWTRFSPLDWRAGVADMSALRKRVQSVLDRQKIIEIRVSDDLHAKIYSFSNNKVILGFANLTWPAMTKNIEVICELTEDDVDGFLCFLSNFRSRLIPVSADVFSDYVDIASDAISKPFDGPVEEDGDMNAAIDLAEETLRSSFLSASPSIPSVSIPEIEAFFEYCNREKTDVSREISTRLKGKYNLQGHVKHCYYGAVQFLAEHPQFVVEVAATHSRSLYDFKNPSIRTQWRDFLRKHADEINNEHKFSFHTLRVYIPESLGGLCTGGGGGSGTLKRVLPVVARMLKGQEINSYGRIS